MMDRSVSARKLRQERILQALALAAFALAAAAGGIFRFRIDFTSGRSFTLSEASRGLHREIPETVSVTYYVSDSLARRHPGPRAVEDLLREMEAHGRGSLRVSVQDPSGREGRVESLGVYPRQMRVEERSEARIATVYSGIVLEYLDDFRVLPAVLGAENLEYEMVKAVRSLVRGVVPVAGLLEGDGDKNPEGDYRLLRAALARAGYEVRILSRGEEVGPDVSVLFLLGNAALDDRDAFHVSRYLSSGGRVLAAVRGVRVDPDRGLRAEPLGNNALLDLLRSYGVQVPEELVLDVSCRTVPFQTRSPQGGAVYRYVRYPHWVAAEGRNVLESHPVTAGFSGLDLYWPSPLEISGREGLRYEALVRSTPRAWKQTRSFAAGPEEESLYREEEDATRGQYVLAAALSGDFPNAFERPVPFSPGGGIPPEDAPAGGTARPGRLVAVGSSDFLTDLMQLSQSEYNVTFAVGAADWLSAEDDLPLPAGTRGIPRLRVEENPEERAGKVLSVYFLNLLLIPFLIASLGLLRRAKRRRMERSARVIARTSRGEMKG